MTGSMQVLRLVAVTLLLAANDRALAESAWLESDRLAVSELRALCERVSDVRMLARNQMIASGDARWRWLARQELVFEVAVMGVPPLDPSHCYVIMRAGQDDETVRRAFEVRDFAANPQRTSVFLVGDGFDPPPAF